MREAVKHWDVVYSMSTPTLASAKEDPKAPGRFVHREVLVGRDREEIVRTVLAKGGTPYKIELRSARPAWMDRVSDEYRERMMLAMCFAVQGGTSAGKALERYILQEEGPMRSRLNLGLDVLRQGRSFVDAIRALDMYDDATIAIIEAGESMGNLPIALKACRDHLEKRSKGNKLIIGAISATAFDLVMAVGTILGMRFQMIPSLQKQGVEGTPEAKQAFQDALALATTGNDIMIALTVVILFGVCMGVYGFYSKDVKLRSMVDSFLNRVPALGSLLEHSAISNTCAVMSALLRGGVMFLPAADITLKGTRHKVARTYWEGAKLGVESGVPVTRAVSSAPMTLNEQVILQAHQSSQQLAETYALLSKQREESADRAGKKFAYGLFWSTTAYTLVGVALTFYVVYVQNSGVVNGLG